MNGNQAGESHGSGFGAFSIRHAAKSWSANDLFSFMWIDKRSVYTEPTKENILSDNWHGGWELVSYDPSRVVLWICLLCGAHLWGGYVQ